MNVSIKLHLLMLCFSLVASAFAQKKIQPLEPSRGHYKELLAFSAKPAPGQEEIDKLVFPYNETAAIKRLSLKPVYLAHVTVEEFQLPHPPANSSEQTRAELNYLLWLQNQRTEEEVNASLHMAHIYYNPRVKPDDPDYETMRSNLFYIGRAIGTWFNAENLPATADLMASMWRDASYFIWSLKYKYSRVRPYVLETDIENLEETEWAAYPSGHAANAYINAFIYRELAPQFGDVFMKDAYDMAHSREILGVHFPTDSEVSRIFAHQFVHTLLQNQQFLKDLEVVKKEWAEKAKEQFTKPKNIRTSSAVEKKSCASTCKE